jgi:hypothetical protein
MEPCSLKLLISFLPLASQSEITYTTGPAIFALCGHSWLHPVPAELFSGPVGDAGLRKCCSRCKPSRFKESPPRGGPPSLGEETPPKGGDHQTTMIRAPLALPNSFSVKRNAAPRDGFAFRQAGRFWSAPIVRLALVRSDLQQLDAALTPDQGETVGEVFHREKPPSGSAATCT